MATYFLDSSALVKLYHPEVGSHKVEEIFREPGRRIVISRLTVVEVQSAFVLRIRMGTVTTTESTSLRNRFIDDVATGALTVLAVKEWHYAEAERLINQYGSTKRLRTLDALQLAVALEAKQIGTLDALVAADKALCQVATAEGVSVIEPEIP